MSRKAHACRRAIYSGTADGRASTLQLNLCKGGTNDYPSERRLKKIEADVDGGEKYDADNEPCAERESDNGQQVVKKSFHDECSLICHGCLRGNALTSESQNLFWSELT